MSIKVEVCQSVGQAEVEAPIFPSTRSMEELGAQIREELRAERLAKSRKEVCGICGGEKKGSVCLDCAEYFEI